MKMLQRKGGKVVDRTLRKCYIAVLAHEQKFNKALGYEICATDGDNVPAELLELWEFVQEKRQWFIREHEQLAGWSYEKLCGQVDQRLDILMQFVPYDPNDEDGKTRRSLKHQLAHTPTKRSWQAFQENVLEKSELGKMLQKRSLLLNEKKAIELPRDTALSFALSHASATDVEFCLGQRTLRARQRVQGLDVLKTLAKSIFPLDGLREDMKYSNSIGRLFTTIILRNFTQVSLQVSDAENASLSVASWSPCEAVAGCGANNMDQILEAHLAFSKYIIHILLNTSTLDKDAKTRDNLYYFCIKTLCVRYMFDNKFDISEQLIVALKQLLQQTPTQSKQLLFLETPEKPTMHDQPSPTTLNLYEFLLFSSINEGDSFSPVLKRSLFSLMASHLEMLLSNLQPSVKSDKSTSMSGSYKEYVWENPVNFGCKKSVKGIVIPRPPSMDFSYVISMNVYFHCLSKEQDTMLFKTGNVHKCTEHGKTQSVAFIDRKTGYIHFKTKTRKQKELQITEIETDTSVEVNKWVALAFVRKRLLKGSDHLYVFINGKIAGTTDVAYGDDTVETKSDNMIEASKNSENGIQKINISNALYADVSAKQSVADTRPMRLPLYVGVPSMSPHYAASATATEIAEKYLRDNDNVMFEDQLVQLL